MSNLKKIIPDDCKENEKVIVIGLGEKDKVVLPCGTRIYRLGPPKFSLLMFTSSENLVTIEKYEPTYEERTYVKG